jgi:hypothetical protein
MRIVVATLVLFLACTGAAEAASFRGETSQKRLASVMVGPDGLITRIRISYSAPCASDPKYRFANVLRLEPPFATSTTDELNETVKLSDRLSGGGRSRQTATVTAHRSVDASGESWRGTFKTTVVITRGGKRVDTCRLKRVTWTATPTA